MWLPLRRTFTCCHCHLHQSRWNRSLVLPMWTYWCPWSLADLVWWLSFSLIVLSRAGSYRGSAKLRQFHNWLEILCRKFKHVHYSKLRLMAQDYMVLDPDIIHVLLSYLLALHVFCLALFSSVWSYLLKTFSQVTLVLRMTELQNIFPQQVL